MASRTQQRTTLVRCLNCGQIHRHPTDPSENASLSLGRIIRLFGGVTQCCKDSHPRLHVAAIVHHNLEGTPC